MLIESKILGLPYKYHAAPSVVLPGIYNGEQTIDGLLERRPAVNCITAAYLLTMLYFDIRLPIHFDTVYLILDQTHLRTLDDSEPLQRGDLVFVSKSEITKYEVIPENIKDDPKAVRAFKELHPGPHVLWFDGENYIHGSYYSGNQVVKSAPDELFSFPNYSTLCARRRVIT